jgi:hypothetical protein
LWLGLSALEFRTATAGLFRVTVTMQKTSRRLQGPAETSFSRAKFRHRAAMTVAAATLIVPTQVHAQSSTENLLITAVAEQISACRLQEIRCFNRRLA